MSVDGRDPAHWEGIYRTKGDAGVSWYQPEAAQSLTLIDALALPAGSRIVDIGGGASPLVDGLLDRGYTDVTVLDLSLSALEASAARLGARGAVPSWVPGDVLDWTPPQPFDLWHDRAVFHFLTRPEQREQYRRVLAAGTKPGSRLVIGTFALDGPEQCSGLPVNRYDAGSLAAEFAPEWEAVADTREQHTTPWGAEQSFTWVVLRRGWRWARGLAPHTADCAGMPAVSAAGYPHRHADSHRHGHLRPPHPTASLGAGLGIRLGVDRSSSLNLHPAGRVVGGELGRMQHVADGEAALLDPPEPLADSE